MVGQVCMLRLSARSSATHERSSPSTQSRAKLNACSSSKAAVGVWSDAPQLADGGAEGLFGMLRGRDRSFGRCTTTLDFSDFLATHHFSTEKRCKSALEKLRQKTMSARIFEQVGGMGCTFVRGPVFPNKVRVFGCFTLIYQQKERYMAPMHLMHHLNRETTHMRACA